jgi:hypothetical protein
VGKVPWSLWLYVLASVALSAWFVTQVSGPLAALVLFGVIMLAWAVALLSGVRWLWIATVAVGALGLISNLATGPRTWHGIAGGVISLGLLLLPATRRYFANEPLAAKDSESEVAST